MKPNEHLHPWNVTAERAVEIQTELAPLVERRDRLGDPVRYVAGVDVAYEKDAGKRVFAGMVIIDLQTNETVETATHIGINEFPYTPGLFSFRELPALLGAFEGITHKPDLVICDGQGIAHPRRFGLASHLGVLLDLPSIGCGKTCLLGKFSDLGHKRASLSPLIDMPDDEAQEEVIANAVRTQDGVNPLYVSIGHRVSLETASNWIIQLADKYRQPEPIRQANELVNHLRAKGS